jgi:hypothetical protein
VGEAATIGLDLATQVFHPRGRDAWGRPVFSCRITRAELIEFFASQPKCTSRVTGRAWLDRIEGTVPCRRLE